MAYANYEWYLGADLSEYSGKWVLIDDKNVVDSGSNVGSLISAFKKSHPRKRPFVAKVRSRLEF